MRINLNFMCMQYYIIFKKKVKNVTAKVFKI